MQLKTSTLFDVSFFTLSASLQTWHGTQVIKASPVPHSRVALLLFLKQRANFSYTVQSSLAGKGSPPDLVMCLHVLLELWGCLELLPAGLAGVTAAPSQLLAVLLHVDGQLALQGELIPTLGADEILRGRGHPWACGCAGARLLKPLTHGVCPPGEQTRPCLSKDTPRGPNMRIQEITSLLTETQGKWWENTTAFEQSELLQTDCWVTALCPSTLWKLWSRTWTPQEGQERI